MILYHPLVRHLIGLAQRQRRLLYQSSLSSDRVHCARVVVVAAVVVAIVAAFIIINVALIWPTAPFLLTAVVSLSPNTFRSSLPSVHVQSQVSHLNWLIMGGHTKHAGMAKASSHHSSHGNKKHATILQSYQQADRQQTQKRRRDDMIHGKNAIRFIEYLSDSKAGMSYDEREDVHQMDADLMMDVGEDATGTVDAVHSAPPGDEGFDISHAGGEHEAFEGLADEISKLTGLYVIFTGPIFGRHPDLPFTALVSMTGTAETALRSAWGTGTHRWNRW
jgi:hypothetical protein